MSVPSIEVKNAMVPLRKANFMSVPSRISLKVKCMLCICSYKQMHLVYSKFTIQQNSVRSFYSRESCVFLLDNTCRSFYNPASCVFLQINLTPVMFITTTRFVHHLLLYMPRFSGQLLQLPITSCYTCHLSSSS